MQRIAYFVSGTVLGAFLAVAALNAAQTAVRDAVEISPDYYKVVLDNDRVRVLEYHLKPGQTERMHSHRPGVAYVVNGAKIRTISPSGESQVGVLQTGAVHWRENGVTHAVENVGDTEEHAIIMEIKDRK
ncbi:MAG TPA: cytoplasmic protein [Thermoanaerobaculia bacterium]|nr:cytoplasmic protein [Thermoanaerobaculia bacterium]